MKKTSKPVKGAATFRTILGRESKTFLFRLVGEIESALPLRLPILTVPLTLIFFAGQMVATIYKCKRAS